MSGAGSEPSRWVALCGGVGGAKLALGLAHLLGERLTLVVNTGDDFEHLGLHVSPDIDTVVYTLAGLANPATGWGRQDETWSFMVATAQLGGPDWFRLGDADLAMHVARSRALRSGTTLSAFCRDVGKALGIAPTILPMSDDPVRTLVDTDEGCLEFQHYFVRRRCEPRVRAIRFAGADMARPAPAVIAALAHPDLAGVIVCPSNPYLSVDPLLAVPGLRVAVRAAVRAAGVPVVAVSPVVGGQAIKGPTAKIMAELGVAADNATIARHYAGLIDGLVIDTADAGDVGALGMAAHVTQTVMRTLDDRIALARACLTFADRLRTTRRPT